MVQVQPHEPVDTKRGKLRPGAALVILALLLVGFVVFGQLTTPTPEPDSGPPSSPATTLPLTEPTTTVVFTPQGEPLEWAVLPPMRGMLPLRILDVGGQTVVFTTQSNTAGLHMLTLDDGDGSWTTLIDGAQVYDVIETNSGWLAVGSDPESGTLLAWHSADAVTWNSSVLTVDDLVNGGISFAEIYGNGDTTVVVGTIWAQQVSADSEAAAEDAIHDMFGDGVEWYSYFDGIGRMTFFVFAPLGINLGQLTAEELGLDPEDYAYREAEPGVLVWSSSDGMAWSVTRLDPTYLDLSNLTTGPDGRIFATAHDGLITNVLATDDGIVWEQVGTSDREPSAIHPWPLGYLSVGHGFQGPFLMTSTDLLVWETLPVEQFLTPARDEYWYMQAAGSRGHGVAVRAQLGNPQFEFTEATPPSLTSNGYTLTVNQSFLVFTRGGEQVTRVSRSGSSPSENVRSHDSGITFLRQATGEEIMTLTWNQLNALESLTQGTTVVRMGPTADVFFFSSDGEEWIVQDFADVIPPSIEVGELIFAGDSIYAVAYVGEFLTEGTMLLRARLPQFESNLPGGGG